ncbi:hypothetical protein [Leifsonia shinshuensis]|uniref:hypothetical protein n=1 Tax=Leifsonia shinshuensis TaxID=150026 RepID=UPI001625810C|nr:hypothetical protein [Leifsonia shinshuensis]
MEHRVRAHAPWEHTWVVALETSGLLIAHDLPRISVHDLLLDTWDRNAAWR